MEREHYILYLVLIAVLAILASATFILEKSILVYILIASPFIAFFLVSGYLLLYRHR